MSKQKDDRRDDQALGSTKPTAGRIGIVDIGSNTVRLVVYETATRLPIPIFNEKAQCALGRGMSETGVLNPAGVDEARRSLSRFVNLADAMGVEQLQMVATAAVRDASDGGTFLADMERTCGVAVHLLSGAEEARLAAVGLLNGVPEADGILGDLGGGSLDLVGLASGAIDGYATLPLGHLRLAEASGGDHEAARALVTNALSTVDWLPAVSGRTLYAVGGSWRSLARIFIEQTHHPLHVIDNYATSFFDALRLANLIAGLGRNTMERLTSIPSRRTETLPFAAMAMAVLLEVTRPAQVVFSAFGMREGQMLELLPPQSRGLDPLISACESQAERTGRFAIHGEEICQWMAPLFPDDGPTQERLRRAACLLSDIGWSEHPDYRALHAYQRVLRIPYPGLTHPDRAELALAVLMRYGGDVEAPEVATHRALLDDERYARAQIIGIALRLAQTLSGGAPGVLRRTNLKVKSGRLILDMPADSALISDAVERRLRTLARATNLKEKTEGG